MAQQESRSTATSSSPSGLTRRQGSQGVRRGQELSPWGTNPFGLMRRFSEEMDRLFGDLGAEWPFGRLTHWPSEIGSWSPQVEAFQRGSDFIVRADLPGIKKDDINVELLDDAIRIEGERRLEHEEQREGMYRNERSYGTFTRVIPLPEGAIAESAKASYKDGVLEISVQAPPHEANRGRRLQISEGSETSGQQGGQGGKR